MSNLRNQDYVKLSMLANGFVIVNSRLACEIMPGNWPSPSQASSEFVHYRSTIDRGCDGAKRYLCTIGGNDIEVFAKSRKMLAERIEYILGKEVTNIRDYEEAKQEETPVTPVSKKPAVREESNCERNHRMHEQRKEERAAQARLEQERHEQEQAKYLKEKAETRKAAQERADRKKATV